MAKYMTEYIDKEKAIYLVEKAVSKADALTALQQMSAADVVPVRHRKWIFEKDRKFIDLESANEQYKELGYPHRPYCNVKCSNCGMITIVDKTIRYDFCPHCGADMRERREQE